MKAAAEELGLPVHQPEALRDKHSVQMIAETKPELLVVIAYGEILQRNVLDIASHGAVNVHPSLLPRYRGSAPVRTAILNGDATTGVSIIQLIRKLDAGPILRQDVVDILPEDDAETLTDRLSLLAASVLPDTCDDWISGEITPTVQDESAATMTREWTRHDAVIDWQTSATVISRLVRASQPWPVAWTTLDGDPFRIHAASVAEQVQLPPGVCRKIGKRILVGCGDNALMLKTVQPSGKRAMPAMNWWNGVQSEEIRFER